MTTSHPLHVLVTGATGKQGGAVAREMLSHGHRVRALTRDPASEAARALADLGAETVRGDFGDAESLRAAATGVDVVFAMSSFWETGTDDETRHGIALIDAVADTGIEHFVFTSVASADQNTGVPHFDSKYRIERHLVGSGLPHTILRPAYFMENVPIFSGDGLAHGKYTIALSPDRPLQQITVGDIGKFALHVMENRGDFIGSAIDIAGDELTGNEVAQIISTVTGVPVEYEQMPIDALRAFSHDVALMFEFFENVGMKADISTLRARYPQVGWTRFEDWATSYDWDSLIHP